jgi:16S rRNA (cytidine1402-2'-O)-methyltransferase
MKLYIIPTPVGNLEDITLRSLRILKEVDLILAEDTRTSSVLLKHYEISKPMWSYHMHNEHTVLEKIISEIKAGKSIALISDAGTPSISDPGFLLVRECLRNGIDVDCLPGATAFVPALVNSGFPSNSFVFEGFLPPKKGRHTMLTKLSTETRTIIFYESPMRVVKSLIEWTKYVGEEREVCVCREISKKFEESIRGTFKDVIAYYTTKPPKGEIVVVVKGLEK